MDNYMVWVWLGVTVLALVVEFSTTQLVSFWFAIAGGVTLALSFIPGFPWWGQIILFAGLSVILFFAFRPFVKKWLKKHEGKNTNTNMDLIIGMYVRLIEGADFDNLGSAKIGDVVWSVKSKDETVLEKDEIVKIVAIEGNKLIAEKVENKKDIEEVK